jgi:hypothetical protein
MSVPPTEQLAWMMGIRSVAYETVFVEAPAPQGELPAPVEAPALVVPDVDPVPAEPEPDIVPLAPDIVPVALIVPAPEVEPLPAPGLVPQARPTAMEAKVAKERILDVARCMKTVLST